MYQALFYDIYLKLVTSFSRIIEVIFILIKHKNNAVHKLFKLQTLIAIFEYELFHIKLIAVALFCLLHRKKIIKNTSNSFPSSFSRYFV